MVEVFLPSPVDGVFGWGLRQYREDGRNAVMAIDPVRGIEKPSSRGAHLSGGFDMMVAPDLTYIGLAGPFVVEDFGPVLIRAFRSSADTSADYLLTPTGDRIGPVPGDSYVPGDLHLWSAVNA